MFANSDGFKCELHASGSSTLHSSKDRLQLRRQASCDCGQLASFAELDFELERGPIYLAMETACCSGPGYRAMHDASGSADFRCCCQKIPLAKTEAACLAGHSQEKPILNCTRATFRQQGGKSVIWTLIVHAGWLTVLAICPMRPTLPPASREAQASQRLLASSHRATCLCLG